MKKDMIFFDPLSDFGFKRIFASEENKDLLINFLNACIADDVGTITDLSMLPNEQSGVSPRRKKSFSTSTAETLMDNSSLSRCNGPSSTSSPKES